MADIDKALDTLSQMLSSDEGKQTLNDMISSVSTGNSLPDTANGSDIDTILMLKHAMDEFKKDDDRRLTLLQALKPYLNSSRLGKIDGTMNLLRMMKLPVIAKSLRKRG